MSRNIDIQGTPPKIAMPQNDKDFEVFCNAVYSVVYRDPTCDLLGRKGQNQYGMDAILIDYRARRPDESASSAPKNIGLQFKFKDQSQTERKANYFDVTNSLDKLDTLVGHNFHLLIVATNAPPDSKLTLRVDNLSLERHKEGKCRVKLATRGTLEGYIKSEQDLAHLADPDYNFSGFGKLDAPSQGRLVEAESLIEEKKWHSAMDSLSKIQDFYSGSRPSTRLRNAQLQVYWQIGAWKELAPLVAEKLKETNFRSGEWWLVHLKVLRALTQFPDGLLARDHGNITEEFNRQLRLLGRYPKLDGRPGHVAAVALIELFESLGEDQATLIQSSHLRMCRLLDESAAEPDLHQSCLTAYSIWKSLLWQLKPELELLDERVIPADYVYLRQADAPATEGGRSPPSWQIEANSELMRQALAKAVGCIVVDRSGGVPFDMKVHSIRRRRFWGRYDSGLLRPGNHIPYCFQADRYPLVCLQLPVQEQFGFDEFNKQLGIYSTNILLSFRMAAFARDNGVSSLLGLSQELPVITQFRAFRASKAPRFPLDNVIADASVLSTLAKEIVQVLEHSNFYVSPLTAELLRGQWIAERFRKQGVDSTDNSFQPAFYAMLPNDRLSQLTDLAENLARQCQPYALSQYRARHLRIVERSYNCQPWLFEMEFDERVHKLTNYWEYNLGAQTVDSRARLMQFYQDIDAVNDLGVQVSWLRPEQRDILEIARARKLTVIAADWSFYRIAQLLGLQVVPLADFAERLSLTNPCYGF